MVSLTPNAVSMLHSNETPDGFEPWLQIIDIKKIKPASGAGGDRYRYATRLKSTFCTPPVCWRKMLLTNGFFVAVCWMCSIVLSDGTTYISGMLATQLAPVQTSFFSLTFRKSVSLCRFVYLAAMFAFFDHFFVFVFLFFLLICCFARNSLARYRLSASRKALRDVKLLIVTGRIADVTTTSGPGIFSKQFRNLRL